MCHSYLLLFSPFNFPGQSSLPFVFEQQLVKTRKKNPSNQYSNTLTIEERVMNRMIANNTLSSDSDENEISLYIITICSNNQAMRIKNVMTKDKMS